MFCAWLVKSSLILVLSVDPASRVYFIYDDYLNDEKSFFRYLLWYDSQGWKNLRKKALIFHKWTLDPGKIPLRKKKLDKLHCQVNRHSADVDAELKHVKLTHKSAELSCFVAFVGRVQVQASEPAARVLVCAASRGFAAYSHVRDKTASGAASTIRKQPILQASLNLKWGQCWCYCCQCKILTADTRFHCT